MQQADQEQRDIVYAAVGKALQQAQHYEEAFKYFARVAARIAPQGPAAREFGELVPRLDKQTLGFLLGVFKRHVRISDPGIPEMLQAAAHTRKLVAHSFFLERDCGNLIADEDGRCSMLTDLDERQALLRKAGNMMRAMGGVLEETIDGTRTKSSGPGLFSIEIDEL
jgi:hypothetical protein